MAYKKRQEISVDELNDMQRYLGEETIEDYQAGRLGVIPENALMPHTGV